jgi:hypothetical protein
MKTYDITTYSNWKDLANELTAELNELLDLPVQVEHAKFGDGIINSVEVSVSDSTVNILSPIDFNGKIQPLALNIVLARNLIEIPEPAKSILVDFSLDCSKLEADIRALSKERTTARLEAEKQAQELAKQEAKRQERMNKAIQNFETEQRKTRTTSATGEFYFCLGWLAKYVGKISATIPDYLLTYFQKQFGTDYVPNVVDSKKLTFNGDPMKWGLSMQAGIPKKVQDTVPAFIAQYLNKARTQITSTSFIWDLIDTYGFQFGDTQDIDQIKATIPDHCIEPFENGYAS